MCARCAALEAEIDRIRQAADVDITNLQTRLTVEMRKVTELRNRLEGQEADKPGNATVKRIADHWKQALGHPKAKVPAGGKRWQKVQSRLNDGYTEQQLLKAVDGCARFPFVGPHGRVAEQKPGTERHDDLELICRDETYVDRFIKLADKRDTPPAPTPVRPRPAKPSDACYADMAAEYDPVREHVRAAKHFKSQDPFDHRDPVTKMLDALSANGRTWRATGLADWMAQCPAHDDGSPSLHLRWDEAGQRLLVFCHAGCETVYVMDALGLSLSDLFMSRREAA